MGFSAGDVIGPYRIVEQVGRGGMATVYKAHQASLARYVAIKVLPEFLASEDGFKERFQQEAVAVAKLRHPNILAVYDYGTSDGTAYIVNEFVDGGTLSDQLGSPLPVDYVVTILGPLSAALDYAHARGILHRDIKPSNVLLNMDGSPILADFGLAKMMESKAGLTQTGMIVGTPEYMSPEQCEGEQVGAPADLYSLGVMAYQMLTGQLPFQAHTPAAVIAAQMFNKLPPPRSINPDLSPGVEGVLLKALAKTPGDRYKSAASLVKALHEAPATPAAAPPPPVAAAPQPPAPVAPAPQPPPPPVIPAPRPSYPVAQPYAPAAVASTLPVPGRPAPGPAYAAPSPPHQPAWRAPAQARPSTPVWVTIAVAIGAAIDVCWGLLAVAVVVSGNTDAGGSGLAAIWGLESLVAGALGVMAAIGLYRGSYWARGLAWVASIAMFVSCFGVVAAVPAMVGLGVSHNQRQP